MRTSCRTGPPGQGCLLAEPSVNTASPPNVALWQKAALGRNRRTDSCQPSTVKRSCRAIGRPWKKAVMISHNPAECAKVLETIAGTKRVTEACAELGICQQRFETVRQEAIHGLDRLHQRAVGVRGEQLRADLGRPGRPGGDEGEQIARRIRRPVRGGGKARHQDDRHRCARVIHRSVQPSMSAKTSSSSLGKRLTLCFEKRSFPSFLMS